MKKPIVFAATACISALVGSALQFVVTDSLAPWIIDGYLFVLSLWAALRIVHYRARSGLRMGHIFAQVLLALVWWPLVLGGGLLGLIVAKDVTMPGMMHSFIMYGFAATVAVVLGAGSLSLRGLPVPFALLCGVLATNLLVIAAGLVSYKHFQVAPFVLSNHYDAWLVLILFLPLAALNGWAYGRAVDKRSAEQAVGEETVG